ncbi:MAG: F0F1 ATP synthase subunit epsilon [Alicyclobacillus macrosporangiidus]|uniref:F0F1 ATP synthase subunit epsilon n=1 Tax=Alicyclobacillus macrosporangiidus TaxID=392015 RepID=UPI0026ED0435|nr:F0F1 ATP synthase subunit epsilon [Alicyclobacillus macrosporangiidus]MCL6598395.1 F0F1 ATP synthase subunit epsilon [Alicyclobacillus macrosporangiidus]
MSSVLFEVVTPERTVLSEQVHMVSVRTGGGELGILPRHAPLAATVKPCVVRVKLEEGEDYVHVSGGFLEVLPDRVTILAKAAETAEDIDVERAQRAKERAEQRLAQRTEDIDVRRAEAALMRALHRLEVVERSDRAGRLLERRRRSS